MSCGWLRAMKMPKSRDEGWLSISDGGLLRDDDFDDRDGFSGVWYKRTSINSFFGFTSWNLT